MNLLRSSKAPVAKAIAAGADSLVDWSAAAGDESSIMSPQESDVPAKPEAESVAAPANPRKSNESRRYPSVSQDSGCALRSFDCKLCNRKKAFRSCSIS
jgi:hypothetical protein